METTLQEHSNTKVIVNKNGNKEHTSDVCEKRKKRAAVWMKFGRMKMLESRSGRIKF